MQNNNNNNNNDDDTDFEAFVRHATLECVEELHRAGYHKDFPARSPGLRLDGSIIILDLAHLERRYSEKCYIGDVCHDFGKKTLRGAFSAYSGI